MASGVSGFGVAGDSGNGQQELADTLTGLRAPTRGRIAIDGADLAGRDVPPFAGGGCAPSRPTVAAPACWPNSRSTRTTA